jgi:hypothetical protein
MARYILITLVDITRNNITRSETDQLKVKQQANFNSLTQAIGLRANITWSADPKYVNGSLPFGLGGKAAHWEWLFDTEREDVFRRDDDAVALLVEDLNGVPVIDGLNNSVDLNPSAFVSKGPKPNIWVFEDK